MNCKAAITENFAGAIQGDQLTKRVNAILEEQGFTPENTLFANSTCPDEINRFVTSFEQYWGENFPLGGLAGLPFTGVTGFGAYSHHVPDGGNLFILYASHIGINDKGELGKFLRCGMTHETTSCGSAIAAYFALQSGKPVFPDVDSDSQQYAVMKLIERSQERINGSNNPLIEISQVVYEQMDRELREVIIPGTYDGNIALLGGIQINTPLAQPDYILVQRFEIINPAKDYREDLLNKL